MSGGIKGELNIFELRASKKLLREYKRGMFKRSWWAENIYTSKIQMEQMEQTQKFKLIL